MKKAYYYLFYKFYKLWEYISIPKFWSDWKAGISIIALEIWIVLSFIVYYKIYINRYFDLEINHPMIIISVIIIFMTNYYAFIHTDIWKGYVKKFDQLPKKKNRIGSWIVFGIVLFVIANLIFSFYLMSKIDWSLYK